LQFAHSNFGLNQPDAMDLIREDPQVCLRAHLA